MTKRAPADDNWHDTLINWLYFLKQREQILKDKWIQPRNAGFDIGMERAIPDWLQKNQDLWAADQDDAEDSPPSPPPP